MVRGAEHEAAAVDIIPPRPIVGDGDRPCATVVEGGAVRVAQHQDARAHHGGTRVGIRSRENLVSYSNLSEASATREHTGVGRNRGSIDAVVVRRRDIAADGEGVRPHGVTPAALKAAEVVGSGTSEAEGERAGVVGIEIERGTGQRIGIGEDKRTGRDAGGAGKAVASGKEHPAESGLDEAGRCTTAEVHIDQRCGDHQIGTRRPGHPDIEGGGTEIAQLDAIICIHRGVGSDRGGSTATADIHRSGQLKSLPRAATAADRKDRSVGHVHHIEGIEGGDTATDCSIIDHATVHIDHHGSRLTGIAEDIVAIAGEGERATAIDCDRTGGSACIILIVCKDQIAGIHDREAAETVIA